MAIASKRRKINRPKHNKTNQSVWLDDNSVRGWGNEVLAILFFATSILLCLSCLSILVKNHFSNQTLISFFNYIHSGLGIFGSNFGGFFANYFGFASFAIFGWLFWIGYGLWVLDENIKMLTFKETLYRLIGAIILTLALSATISVIALDNTLKTTNSLWGGNVGATISSFLLNLSGFFGSLLVLSVFLVASISIATKKTLSEVLLYLFDITKFAGKKILITLPILFLKYSIIFIGLIFSIIHLLVNTFIKTWSWLFSGPTPNRQELKENHDNKFEIGSKNTTSTKNISYTKSKLDIEVVPQNQSQEVCADFEISPPTDEQFSHVVVSRRVNKPIPLEIQKEAKKIKKIINQPEADFSEYKKPKFDLLTRSEEIVAGEDDDELIQKSKQIEVKLRDFNILGRVTEVHPGPVITLFEFEPAPGVKVGKISALQDDLAMSLRASSIRIIAPIPKKGTVGIEVPNKNRDMVRLRDVLEHPDFLVNSSLLNIPLGKDTYGDPVYVDISTMPHLLIAGATGTGKSVSINAILLSLLYRASPADLGLILIDPKILELSIYDGIPHLKVPVVTVPKQAKAVLDWAVKEMEKRYRMMQKYGVRNIDGYNKIVLGLKEAKTEVERNLDNDGQDIIDLGIDQVLSIDQENIDQDLTQIKQENTTEPSEEQKLRVEEPLKTLPKIVIVVDELADLMLTVGREIEELITRLAQKARAAGIHLILATQRPSVDVITGLIKANFPARISFRVTSRIDSRTILDSMGAERLLGKGDMLFMHPGSQHLRRIHGAFVSDSEVQKVVESIKAQAEPNYDQKIIEMCEKALKDDSDAVSSDGIFSDEEQFDPLYDKAVEVVVQKGQASTSMIQRVFRIGYNRAARIIEMMEKEGVIGPMEGIKPREVLVNEIGKNEL